MRWGKGARWRLCSAVRMLGTQLDTTKAGLNEIPTSRAAREEIARERCCAVGTTTGGISDGGTRQSQSRLPMTSTKA